MKVILIEILAFTFGIGMLLGSILNWEFLLTGRREDRLARIIGRTGVRIFYGFTGVALLAMGILILINPQFAEMMR